MILINIVALPKRFNLKRHRYNIFTIYQSNIFDPRYLETCMLLMLPEAHSVGFHHTHSPKVYDLQRGKIVDFNSYRLLLALSGSCTLVVVVIKVP